MTRPLEEIRRLIEIYPPSFRRWCDSPENGGCACMGCVRWPAPSTVRGDPEGKPFPNPADRLTKEEVETYGASLKAPAAGLEIRELRMWNRLLTPLEQVKVGLRAQARYGIGYTFAERAIIFGDETDEQRAVREAYNDWIETTRAKYGPNMRDWPDEAFEVPE